MSNSNPQPVINYLPQVFVRNLFEHPIDVNKWHTVSVEGTNIAHLLHGEFCPHSTAAILGVGDRLCMFWVDTVFASADVVQLGPLWDRSFVHFIHSTVGQLELAVHGNSSVPSFGVVVAIEPAPGVRVYSIIRKGVPSCVPNDKLRMTTLRVHTPTPVTDCCGTPATTHAEAGGIWIWSEPSRFVHKAILSLTDRQGKEKVCYEN